jgi:hypothetical protein
MGDRTTDEDGVPSATSLTALMGMAPRLSSPSPTRRACSTAATGTAGSPGRVSEFPVASHDRADRFDAAITVEFVSVQADRCSAGDVAVGTGVPNERQEMTSFTGPPTGIPWLLLS